MKVNEKNDVILLYFHMKLPDSTFDSLPRFQDKIKRKFEICHFTLICHQVRVAYWSATCAQKPKVPGSSTAASYMQR